ncbi:hypothetical protein [Chloroflexus sp.]|uniref:hypothetical protein n=1 Tax=Chloroflexus sp. TaxID=1904827 RepID=UPI002ACEC97C|nr:hypothetical protein [Chloroflexus sp.]
MTFITPNPFSYKGRRRSEGIGEGVVERLMILQPKFLPLRRGGGNGELCGLDKTTEMVYDFSHINDEYNTAFANAVPCRNAAISGLNIAAMTGLGAHCK